MDNLINYLKLHPNIKTVYFNSQGQWLFSPNKQFPVAKSVSDLLKDYDNKTTDEQLAAIAAEAKAKAKKEAADEAKAKAGTQTNNKPK